MVKYVKWSLIQTQQNKVTTGQQKSSKNSSQVTGQENRHIKISLSAHKEFKHDKVT